MVTAVPVKKCSLTQFAFCSIPFSASQFATITMYAFVARPRTMYLDISKGTVTIKSGRNKKTL